MLKKFFCEEEKGLAQDSFRRGIQKSKMMKCTNSQISVNSSFIYLRVHKVGCSILSDIQTSLGGNNLST